MVRLASQDRWPVGAALALELTKQGWTVTVPQDWVFLFGEGTGTTGRESLELVVADSNSEKGVRQYMPDAQFIGQSGNTYLFVRHLSRNG